MSKLTKEQFIRVQEEFKRRDADGNKKVTLEELKKVMGPYFTDEDIVKKFKEMDTDASGEISWEEYLADYKKDLDAPESDA